MQAIYINNIIEKVSNDTNKNIDRNATASDTTVIENMTKKVSNNTNTRAG